MPKIFLKHSHPSLFVFYHGVIVTMLGTGLASVLSNPSNEKPPILETFYRFLPINVWGVLYIILGIVLVVGLFSYKYARLGLKLAGWALLVRLIFQLWQSFFIWRDDLSGVWYDRCVELMPKIAGLPILYGFVVILQGMLQEPFTNPDASPDITAFRVPNGDGDDS